MSLDLPEAELTSSHQQEARRFFSVFERRRWVMIPVEEVIFLRAEYKYITVATEKRDYLMDGTLINIEEEFGGRFLRIHRNCLIATEFIESFGRDSDNETDERCFLTLRGRKERLSVSRRQRAAVRALIKQGTRTPEQPSA